MSSGLCRAAIVETPQCTYPRFMMYKLTAIYFETSKADVINKYTGLFSARYVEYGWIDGTRLIEKVLYAHDYVIEHNSGVN